MVAWGGIILCWPGVGAAWMNVSDGAARHMLWITRTAKRVLSDIARTHKLHRVEAAVLADNIRNCRWIEALGFTHEGGVARRYTPDGRDAVRYERVTWN